MTLLLLARVVVVLCAVLGAGGVALAAMAAHMPDASRLGPASTMLLFHALAAIGAVLLSDRALVHPTLGMIAAAGLILGTVLFAGDLVLRQFIGHGLFPMAAPSGGMITIAAWLLLGVAALWPAR